MNKKYLIFGLLGLFAIGLVSAIAYYAVFSVNVIVSQPISITGDLSQSVNCEAGETCIGEGITISNDANSERTIKITQTNENENISVGYVGKLNLSYKNSDWNNTREPIQLVYTLVGNEFNYNAELPLGYVLIYYKDGVIDLENRINNPEPTITIVSNIGNLPQSSDANLNANYSQTPDNYKHSTGAKLWAVPSDAILEGNVLNWSRMNEFLFETDLVRYFANSNGEIVIPSNSFITFYPTFTPSVYIGRGSYEFDFEIQ